MRTLLLRGMLYMLRFACAMEHYCGAHCYSGSSGSSDSRRPGQQNENQMAWIVPAPAFQVKGSANSLEPVCVRWRDVQRLSACNDSSNFKCSIALSDGAVLQCAR